MRITQRSYGIVRANRKTLVEMLENVAGDTLGDLHRSGELEAGAMKVWIFVEGRSDVRALEALWRGWRRKLREQGRGIQLIQLDNKPKFLRKIGSRAMEKLVNDPCDLVVGLPDLYPNKGIAVGIQARELGGSKRRAKPACKAGFEKAGNEKHCC